VTDDPKAPDERSVRFEPRDVPALLPLWLAAGLGGFVAIVLGGITLGYPAANHQQYRGPLRSLAPEPRLQVAPTRDLWGYEASKERELSGSKVPIDAAMRATARQGWGPPR
jgi:hypothetical protein